MNTSLEDLLKRKHTNDENCNYFKTKKNNPATHFLKAMYTCTLYSGIQISVKQYLFFYPEDVEVLKVTVHAKIKSCMRLE